MLHPLSEDRVGGWDGRARFSELREVSQSPYGVQQSVGPAVGRGILLLINASSVESPLATIFSLPRPTCVAVFGIDGGGVSTVGPKRGSSACLPRNHPLITHCAPSLTPSLPARLDMDTTGRPWNTVVVAAWHERRGGRRELRA